MKRKLMPFYLLLYFQNNFNLFKILVITILCIRLQRLHHDVTLRIQSGPPISATDQ